MGGMGVTITDIYFFQGGETDWCLFRRVNNHFGVCKMPAHSSNIHISFVFLGKCCSTEGK